ncbi:uncharacterized protein [Blastocystis hominis]|uniref:Mediator of RNA polymerase II transcription subunit 10 n=1 Tax=Blastocystis hominis TaxID=12968 RepID=D8MBS2_BLAHO|nr:uncharacterized protein [Blastocystis hominis]CBK25511.2 unnamed protein product [Blastocystis hominis]|eukprot:XP_012899559.1 uncharacterized protein [Blastocystis hominis]
MEPNPAPGASSIEKDLKDLKETEDKVVQLLDIVREVTSIMGDPQATTDESIERTTQLTRQYLQTVNVGTSVPLVRFVGNL